VLMLLFVGVLLTGLVRIYPTFYEGVKILKALFQKNIQQNFADWSARDFAITLSLSFIVPVVLVGLLAGCIHILCLNERDRVDVTLSTCETVVGFFDDFTYVEENYNHGETIIYNCSFSVDGVRFKEVHVRSTPNQNVLNDLMSGAQFTVCYQTKFDNNLILKIDMHTFEIIP